MSEYQGFFGVPLSTVIRDKHKGPHCADRGINCPQGLLIANPNTEPCRACLAALLDEPAELKTTSGSG